MPIECQKHHSIDYISLGCSLFDDLVCPAGQPTPELLACSLSKLILDLSCSLCSAWQEKDVWKLLSGNSGITIITCSSSSSHSSSSDVSKKFGSPSFANAAFLASKLCRDGGRERVEQIGVEDGRVEMGVGELGKEGEEGVGSMEGDGEEERIKVERGEVRL